MTISSGGDLSQIYRQLSEVLELRLPRAELREKVFEVVRRGLRDESFSSQDRAQLRRDVEAMGAILLEPSEANRRELDRLFAKVARTSSPTRGEQQYCGPRLDVVAKFDGLDIAELEMRNRVWNIEPPPNY